MAWEHTAENLRSNADLLEFTINSPTKSMSQNMAKALIADMRSASAVVEDLTRRLLEAEGKVALLQSFTETPTRKGTKR